MRTSNKKQSVFTLHSSLCTLLLGALLLCGLAPELQAAHGTNIQQNGTTDYWTNSAVWNGADYPGFAANQSAFMTTNMAGGTYTTILDYPLSTLTLLSLSNVSGTATLIVTNDSSTATTLNLGTGGRLQIEAAANVALPVLTVGTLNLNGLDPTITINNGGRLASSAALTLFDGTSGTTALVVRATPGGAGSYWNMAAATFSIGSGTSLQNVVTFDGGGTVGGLTIDGLSQLNLTVLANSSSNKLNLMNGVRLNNSGGTYVGFYRTNVGVVLTVDNSSLSSGLLVIGPGANSAAAGPGGSCSMVVTNGGYVSATTRLALGNFNANQYGGSNNTLSVVGTNSAGSRSAIDLNAGSFLVGAAVGAVSNQVTVDNGMITNAGAVTVGNYAMANFNQLVITNGGQLISGGASSMIGAGAGSLYNSALVSGGSRNSTWDLAGTLLYIGNTGSSNNVVTVDGGGVLGGAALTNVSTLFVGYNSDYNQLNILNGGRVFLPDALAAVPFFGGKTNTLIIDNGTFFCGRELAVGVGTVAGAGGGSGVLITNGASVDVGSLHVGRRGAGDTYLSSNNWVMIGGTNSSGDMATLTFPTNGPVMVGNLAKSASNTLTIGRGGVVRSAGAVIIGLSTVKGNELRIDGGIMTNLSVTVATNNSLVFSSGTLAMESATVENGSRLDIGDGAQAATLVALNAGGIFDFYAGIVINSNSTLRGNGTIKARAPSAVALTVTNGAILAPGLTGPGFLAVSTNMVWSGGSEFQCDITDIMGGAGIGWDSLSVLGSLTLTDMAPKLRITLNSLGSNTANFDETKNYSLKIASCGSVVDFSASDFQISTNAFLPVSSGTWSISSFEGSLYLVYTASGSTPPTADYTWNVPTSGYWDALNWAEGTPTANGNPAWNLTFGGDGTRYGSTNDLAGTFQLSNMVFNSATPSVTNLIAGNPIEFGGAGGGIQQWGSGSYQVSNIINLAADMTFSGPGLGAVILHTNITGAGGITKLDAGKLVLQGSNTFSGPVLVNGNGLLRVDNRKGLGLGSVTVSNGTLLVSSGATTIMDVGQPGYDGLTALVTGSGSLWTNNAIFKLGTNSSFNTLTIANTGRMDHAAAVVIGDNGPSNTAVVRDGGLWNLGGNNLTIGNRSATGNVVRVEGTGAVITNAPLVVGSYGGWDNKLVLTNNGSVYSTASTIGARATNNTVLVGGGGTWNLGGAGLTIGDGQGSGATGNVLRVDDGGVVTNINLLYVGYWANSQLNGLVITNGGRVHVVGTAAHQIGNSNASNNYIIIEGSNSVGPATLSGNGANTRFYVGGTGTGRGSWVRVGSGGLISLPATAGGLRAGFNIGNNYIIITNGGQVITGNSTTPSFNNCVGYGSSNNYAIVTGNNGIQPSTWNGGGAIFEIGNAGTGNWMRVEDGGLVTNVGAVTLGVAGKDSGNSLTVTNGSQFHSSGAGAIGAASASNNSVLVAGADGNGQKALWYANGANFTVGSGTGTGNVLRVGNGGVFSNAVLLFTSPTPANSVVVENGGEAYAALVVGSSASCVSNPVVTAPDGDLWEPGAYVWDGVGGMFGVGNGAASKSNYLWVSGRTFTNFGAVNIGNGAAAVDNRLVLTNGAKLYSAGAGVVGSGAASTNNSVLIAGGEGVQSVWNLGGNTMAIGTTSGDDSSITVDGRGTYGSASLLNMTTLALSGGQRLAVVVTNGGVVSASSTVTLQSSNRLDISTGSQAATAALTVSGRGGAVTVSGADTVLAAGGNFTLGSGSSENLLKISDNGVVTGTSLLVGNAAGGAYNMLVVTNGGKLYGSSAGFNYIGSTTHFNTGLVSGAGSVWDMGAKRFYLGNAGASNDFWVMDNAMVTNMGSYALYAGTIGFHMGYNNANASYNNMVITNGGKMYVREGHDSYLASSGGNSNRVHVTGNNSLLQFADGSLSLVSGIGNRLIIDDGGTVGVGTLSVYGNNNTVTLNGGSLAAVTITNNTGGIFEVGDGAQLATFKSLGGGKCHFVDGLRVGTRGTLMGVGPVVGGAVGVVITNNGTFSAGVDGVGTLTLSNTTWYGGATNLVEISAVNGLAGLGFDTVTINTQLTLTANGGKFVVRMDSLGGNANFAEGRNYNLKFMTYGTATTVNLSDFEVDTSTFIPGGTWWVTNLGSSLYLATTGGTPIVSSYQWDSTKTGAWSVAENWVGGNGPASGGHVTNVLEFGGSGEQSYAATNNLGNDHLLNTLLLTSESTRTNYLLGQSLLFSGAGSGIAVQGSGWTVSTNRMNWTEPLLLSGDGGGGLTLSNSLVGTGAVTVATYGTYVLAESNAFDGPITVNSDGSGKLRVDHTWGLGRTNPVVVSNGTLHANVTFKFGDTGQSGRRGLITGANSLWTNAALTVGGAVGASNNMLTVEKQGRLVTAGALSVGTGGYQGNTLLVTNAGAVKAASSAMGNTNNLILVTGTNSVFDSGTMTMSGVGNRIEIDQAAIVTNAILSMAAASVSNTIVVTNGAIVYGSVNPGGNDGRAWISGQGTLVNGTVNVGSAGGTNCETRLVDRSQAIVAIYVGEAGTTKPGPGSRLVVDDAIGSATTLTIGTGVDGNGADGVGANDCELVVTNGGQVLAGSAIYEVMLGGYSFAGTYVHWSGPGTNNVIRVYSNSFLTAPAGLSVGYLSGCQYNRLIVDGGSVTNGSTLTVANNQYTSPVSSGNSVLVTNGGFVVLAGASGLRVAMGTGSFSNSVDVSAGGVLNAAGGPITIGVGVSTWSNSLAVRAGGIVTNVGTLKVGNPTSANQLFISGGSLSVTNLAVSNVNNTVMFSSGTLNMRGAFISNNLPLVVGSGNQSAILSLVSGGTSIFGHGLTITNNATLTGVGAITGNTTVYGTNSPGTAGIGVITNSGNVTLAASAVSRFEIGTNTTAGSGWDHLAVTGGGTLTVGGKLIPILTGGFSPTNTMSFVIMTNTTASVSGSFANETSGKVNVYTNDSVTSLVGTFNVTVSNSQYVVLTNFKPPLASGTIFKFR